MERDEVGDLVRAGLVPKEIAAAGDGADGRPGARMREVGFE